MSEDGYGTGGPLQNGCAFSKLRECAICTLRLHQPLRSQFDNTYYVKRRALSAGSQAASSQSAIDSRGR